MAATQRIGLPPGRSVVFFLPGRFASCTEHTQDSETAKKAADRAKEQAVADAAEKEAAAKAKAITDATQKAAADAAAKDAAARAASAKSTELEAYVTGLGLKVSNLDIRFNDGCAYVAGDCPTQADLEKLVLAVGNVGEVGRVIESVKVAAESEANQFYVVVKGDNLSKIAKHFYADANKYPVNFEANKPILKDPDEIFPGQSLRIPAL